MGKKGLQGNGGAKTSKCQNESEEECDVFMCNGCQTDSDED